MTKQQNNFFDEKQYKEYSKTVLSELDKWWSYLCHCCSCHNTGHHRYKEEIFDVRKEPGLYCQGSLYETYEECTEKGKYYTEHKKSGVPCRII